MSEENTPTPETDAMEYDDEMCTPRYTVESDFARKLERQRDGAFALIDYAGDLLGVPKKEHKSAHGFAILQAIKDLVNAKNNDQAVATAPDSLAVRACNQAAKMARLIQVVMEHTARYAADAEPALARQFAMSAWGIIECLGDLMNARDMVDHEDLEGVDELLADLRALIPANK